jgi:hypothetical protein
MTIGSWRFHSNKLVVLLKYLSDHYTALLTIPSSGLCSLNTHRADLPPINHIISQHATTRPFPTSRPDRRLLPIDTDSDHDQPGLVLLVQADGH